jgi:hypothetical protein
MADAQPPVGALAPAPPQRAIRVHALLLGERLSRSAVDADGALTTAPLSFRVGDDGFVVLFRYGVAVLFGLDEAAEAEALAGLASRMAGPVEAQEDETAQVLVRPGEEEHITPTGAIQLRTTRVASLPPSSLLLGRSGKPTRARPLNFTDGPVSLRSESPPR